MKKNIFILVGHPDLESSSVALAVEYQKAAEEAGHQVRRMNIGELQFDPILHKGYKVIQELEPDLISVQENFKWANHVVIFYPNWWCTMPAILKGMFDRMFLPGFAFRFKKNSKGEKTKWVERLLKGKSARVVVTTGTHPLLIRLMFGDFTNEIARGTLGFSGMSPVYITTLGPCENAPERRRNRWHRLMHRLGAKAK